MYHNKYDWSVCLLHIYDFFEYQREAGEGEAELGSSEGWAFVRLFP